MMNARTNARSGFTLIELMIAITIFAIISVVVGQQFLGYLQGAKISRVNANLLSLKSAITEYKFVFNKYPSRLKDLVQAPTDEKDKAKWPGSFLEKKELPEDPWNNNYQYKLNQAGAEHEYELYSYGPNGKGAPQGEWISVWKI